MNAKWKLQSYGFISTLHMIAPICLDYFPINHVGDTKNETPSGSVDSKRRHHKILLIPTKNSSVCWFSCHRLHILNPTKCYNNKEQITHRK